MTRIIRTFGLELNLQLNRLSDSWSRIVGDTVAFHSSPERLRQKILYVAVDSPIWMQQLSFFKKDIIEKINKEVGTELISDIRFVLRDVKFEDLSSKQKTKDKVQDVQSQLTTENILDIQEWLSAINDSEIKESVKRAIVKALQKSSG